MFHWVSWGWCQSTDRCVSCPDTSTGTREEGSDVATDRWHWRSCAAGSAVREVRPGARRTGRRWRRRCTCSAWGGKPSTPARGPGCLWRAASRWKGLEIGSLHSCTHKRQNFTHAHRNVFILHWVNDLHRHKWTQLFTRFGESYYTNRLNRLTFPNTLHTSVLPWTRAPPPGFLDCRWTGWKWTSLSTEGWPLCSDSEYGGTRNIINNLTTMIVTFPIQLIECSYWDLQSQIIFRK